MQNQPVSSTPLFLLWTFYIISKYSNNFISNVVLGLFLSRIIIIKHNSKRKVINYFILLYTFYKKA
jgi:hypothetical protein